MADRKITIGIVLKAVSGAAGKALSAFGGVASKAFKVVAGAAIAAAGALAGMIAKTISLSDALMNASERTGASSEFLSAIGFNAKAAGSSLGTLEKSLQNLAKGAVTGSKSFSKWGVDIKNADGSLKSSEQLFRSAAEKISTLKSGTVQMAAAQDLLGKAGKELLPILKGGAAGIDEMMASADAAGITISSLSVRLGDELGDQMAKSTEQTNALFTQISTFFMPILIVLVRRFNEAGGAVRKWSEANKGLINANLVGFLTWIADSALPAIAVGADLVAKVWLGWKLLFQTLQMAGAAFASGMLDIFAAVAGGAADLARFLGAEGLATDLEALSASSAKSAKAFENDFDLASAAMARTSKEISSTESAIGRFGASVSSGLRSAIDDAKALTAEFAAMGATGGGGSGGAGEIPDIGKKKKEKFMIFGPSPAQLKQVEAARKHDPLDKKMSGIDSKKAGEAKRLADQRVRTLQLERDRVKELNKQYQDLGASMGDALGAAFASVVTGSESAGDAFKAMAKQMLLSILSVAETQIMAAAASGGAQAGASASSLPFPANLVFAPIAAAAMFGLLRGFLGKMHTGGIVPGPEGKEHLKVVQAGEEVTSIAQRKSREGEPDRGGHGGGMHVGKVEVQALSVPSRAGWERTLEDGLMPTVDRMAERGVSFGRRSRRRLQGRG